MATCERSSENLARHEIEDEIKDLLYNENAIYHDTELSLSSGMDASKTKDDANPEESNRVIEKKILKLIYNEYAEYKEVNVQSSDAINVPSTNNEERCPSRRTGTVDRPMATNHVYNDFQSDITEFPKMVKEEGTRSRNLSEASYFAQRKATDVAYNDDMCCDVTFQGDHVCPSRLNSCHGRFSMDNITNAAAIKCLRWRMRRNALCDPLRLLLPQRVRERLERDNEKRKASVARKVSQFMTVNFDLNRDEDLI